MIALDGIVTVYFSIFLFDNKKESLLYILSRVIRVTRFKNFPSRTRWRETNRESTRGGLSRAWFDIFFPLGTLSRNEVEYLVDLRRWVEQVICKRRIDERSILTKRIYEATGNRGWNISFFILFSSFSVLH